MTEQPATRTTPPAQDVWTVRRVLEWTTTHLQKHGSETPRLDAEILLAHSRQCPRIKLYTEYDEPLDDAVRAKMKELVKRRAAREPVAYLVGFREFFSLTFRVTPDVLIPRPDSESLVVETLASCKSLPAAKVLELCTGSGCLAVSIAANNPQCAITATDISPAALKIASENADKHSVADRINFLEGDLFQPIPEGRQFDVLVSNPPYVTTAEIAELDADVKHYEPHLALDGGTTGLDVIERIVSEAPRWLKPGGWLLLEMDPQQFAAVNQLAQQQGCYVELGCLRDLAGRQRVWKARLADSPAST